jgi:hypothetical protein
MEKHALRKEGDETIRFLRELKELDVDIGTLLMRGAKGSEGACGGDDKVSAGVKGMVVGLKSFVRGEMAKELRGAQRKDDGDEDGAGDNFEIVK